KCVFCVFLYGHALPILRPMLAVRHSISKKYRQCSIFDLVRFPYRTCLETTESHMKGSEMKNISIDLRGLNPAPVTPFTRDGAVDYAAIKKLGSWLGSIDGVKSLTVLGHAGEGTFLERDEQTKVIEAFVESVNGAIPIIAG